MDKTTPDLTPITADAKARRHCGIATVVVAGVLLGVPAIAMLWAAPDFFRQKADPLVPTTAQEASLRARFHRFANEGYPLATQLATAGGRLKVDIMGESASAAVVLGQHGWLYYAADGGDTVIRRDPPWRALDLALLNTWFATNRKAAADRGITYVVLVTPAKGTIHPEFLPEHWQPSNRPSHCDVLLDHLRKQQPELRVLDTRTALKAARNDRYWTNDPTPGLVYQRTDTHWNDLGAWAAVEQLVTELRSIIPQTPAPDRSLLQLSVLKRSGGDLARLMALDQREHEVIPRLTWISDGLPTGDISEDTVLSLLHTPGPPGLGKLAVFRDSFSARLIPLLQPFASQISWAWSYHLLDSNVLNILASQGVEVIVHQISERHLVRPEFYHDAARELRAWGVPPIEGF